MLLLCGLMALLVLPGPGVMAQLGPVRLAVTKIQKAETQRIVELGMYGGPDIYGTYKASESVLQVGAFVHYHIELALMSPKPLPALRIEWELLVQPADEQEPRVIRGQRTGELDLGKHATKFECDTKIVHVRTKEQASRRSAALARSPSPQTPGIGRSSAKEAIVMEVLGYSVKVFDGDQVIASDTQPPDVKRKLDLLRDTGNSRQERQQF